MSKIDKILKRLMNPSVILSFQELEYLLGKLGYKEKKTRKTSGSRKAYVNMKTKHLLRIHKPHPGNEIKRYAKNYIIRELKKQNLI